MQKENDIEKRLEGYFESLDSGIKAIKDLRKAFNENQAFDFNTLNFFDPGENKTSEILSFFLDPHQTHGQGKAFLEVFCDLLIKKEAFCFSNHSDKDIKVVTEHRTDNNRRIDITVEFGDREFLIGIENKIGAKDGEKQVIDYSVFLKNHSKGDYVLFYLTPYGGEPSDSSIGKDDKNKLQKTNRLKCISYKEHIIDV